MSYDLAGTFELLSIGCRNFVSVSPFFPGRWFPSIFSPFPLGAQDFCFTRSGIASSRAQAGRPFPPLSHDHLSFSGLPRTLTAFNFFPFCMILRPHFTRANPQGEKPIESTSPLKMPLRAVGTHQEATSASPFLCFFPL